MSDRALSELSSAELVQEVESLRQRLEHLEKVKLAFDAQDELVRSLVSMGRAATGRLMLRSMLLQTIKVSVKLTNAEESSLFLLDDNGAVTESILARGATIREQRNDLIGKVLDSGLAGWVVRNKRLGIITDTRNDDRWMTLPNQPYTVGSALCIPILRGKALLGLLTLTHRETHHFTSEPLSCCKCAPPKWRWPSTTHDSMCWNIRSKKPRMTKRPPLSKPNKISHKLASLSLPIMASSYTLIR